ncbi:hypothetical protein M885DRAFT_529956 [Pelagophyceae sp. CCMP2097]|nr:hypothetical protein M885DRAFT_529956 [Pelagophyceae sp. CCMP2097]
MDCASSKAAGLPPRPPSWAQAAFKVAGRCLLSPAEAHALLLAWEPCEARDVVGSILVGVRISTSSDALEDDAGCGDGPCVVVDGIAPDIDDQDELWWSPDTTTGVARRTRRFPGRDSTWWRLVSRSSPQDRSPAPVPSISCVQRTTPCTDEPPPKKRKCREATTDLVDEIDAAHLILAFTTSSRRRLVESVAQVAAGNVAAWC